MGYSYPFMTLRLLDIIDILLVATILYWCYQLLRRSGASNLFWGIVLVVMAWFLVSGIFHLEMTGAIFDRVISVGAFAVIVLFQEELRSFFYRLGANLNIVGLGRRFLPKEKKQADQYVGQIALACSNMQKTHTGALIVMEGDALLHEYADTGEAMGAVVSARLIEQIFFKNTPLHDGALILSHGKMMAAACILPVSKNNTIPAHYGLRHRAALGISEKSDALAIIVSEETGHISVAQDGKIREVSAQELTQLITEFVN
ncbi:MAG: diadenylate cyclase CdaA [Paludibacteraceae bacterium]|nr:diadenylate cyclase CdaA [Paludibacteraceae bacterium]